jgi:hypothetical protein
MRAFRRSFTLRPVARPASRPEIKQLDVVRQTVLDQR